MSRPGEEPGEMILYLDEAPHQLRQLFQELKPGAFRLLFWSEMEARAREESLRAADYVLVAAREFGRDLIEQASQARLIQKTGIGTDNIDLRAAAAGGVPVANTPGGNSTSVAELTILLILALYRRLLTVDAATKRGEWPMWEFRPSSFEMGGKVLGLVGFGNIGQEVARRARAFGTDVLYHDEVRREGAEQELGASYTPLPELLQRADIVSLHVPLTPLTRHLIGAEELGMMKQGALLINVARGGVVDEGELTEALREGRISGAALDVWESEPVHPENPLLQLENVITTPHVGAGTRDTLSRVLGMAFENIRRVSQGGSPHHIVNGVGSSPDQREKEGQRL